MAGLTRALFATFTATSLTVAALPLSTHYDTVDVSGPEAPAAAPQPTIDWTPSMEDNDGMEYANITVPMDWDNPDTSPKITIAISRLPCTDPNSRLGTIFKNAGGPMPVLRSITLSDDVRKYFDTVSMDPRGMGQSSPLNCPKNVKARWPDSSEGFDSQLEAVRNAVMNCSETSPLVQYMDSISIAKDVEAIRVALNESKWSFIGQSWGTQLAASYLELFPDKLTTVVMDGVADHTVAPFDSLSFVLKSDQAHFDRWAEWCASNEECPLHGKDSLQYAKETFEQAGDHADCLADELVGHFESAQLEPAYRRIAKTLKSAHDNRSTIENLERCRPKARSNLQPLDVMAVDCADMPPSNLTFSDLTHQQSLLASDVPTAQYLGGRRNFYFACAAWPWKDRNPPHRLRLPQQQLPKVMLVNSLFDLRTPHENAKNVQAQIPGSVLLTTRHVGYGHCSYEPAAYESEVRRYVDAVFINGTLPEEGIVVGS